MQRESRVLFNWQVSSFFGWGIYGLNLLLGWAGRTDLLPATISPLFLHDIDIDPLELRRIRSALQSSFTAQAELEKIAGQKATASGLVLQPLGNGLPLCPSAHNVYLSGSPTVGVAFLERAPLGQEAHAQLQQFPLVIAGSTWNQKILEEAGAPRVELVLQGVDTSNFHPAPKRNFFANRFVVFSGGKLEYRKGQDLVLRAFRIFAQRHKEALLLTAWSSPWPDCARSIKESADMLPPPFTPDGKFDATGWTRINGVPDDQVFHCESVPNRAMARILREADVALFPNRAEGGTNLVAMECIACGVPTILSANTGHLDLLQDGTVLALRKQESLQGESEAGWGNSDVEEMVEALESVYQDRTAARTRALQGSANLSAFTWTRQMDQLAELLLPLLPSV